MNSSKQNPIYTRAFRANAVKLAEESNQPYAETARKLGINISTLSTWLDKSRKTSGKGKDSEPINDKDIYQQLKDLKKENQVLKEERDILKKAAAYFASHQS